MKRLVPMFECNVPQRTVARTYPTAPTFGLPPDMTLYEVSERILTSWADITDRVIMTTRRASMGQMYRGIRRRHPRVRVTPGLKIDDYLPADAPADYDWLSDQNVWQPFAHDAYACAQWCNSDTVYVMVETPMGSIWNRTTPIAFDKLRSAWQPLVNTRLTFCFYPMYIMNQVDSELWTALLACWHAITGGYSGESYNTCPRYQADEWQQAARARHKQICPMTDERLFAGIGGELVGEGWRVEAYDLDDVVRYATEVCESDDCVAWGTMAMLDFLGRWWRWLVRR